MSSDLGSVRAEAVSCREQGRNTFFAQARNPDRFSDNSDMTEQQLSELARAILYFHVLVITFNLFGLLVIPVGAWRGWAFVRVFWWRALHLAILGIVAVQALFDRICFLTLWQSELLEAAGETASHASLIQRWLSRIIFWPLPLWAFAVLYVLIWIYVLSLWWLVPPRSHWKARS